MNGGRMKQKKIGFLMKQIFFMNQARLNEMFAEFGLTGTQTHILIYLFRSHENGCDVMQRDIEKAMDISNPTVTGILNRLENKGLIVRKTSEKDARIKHIVVTEKALELDKILRKKFAENDAALISCLSKAEADSLEDMLLRILDTLS